MSRYARDPKKFVLPVRINEIEPNNYRHPLRKPAAMFQRYCV